MSIETKIATLMANDAPLCTLKDLSNILLKIRFTKKFQVIAITGTNGKGTTVAMLEKLLIANNKKVLSHTSPHIFTFNERISINSTPISDSYLLELLERLTEITVNYKLSYHQIAFVCMCMCATRENLDYLVLEVGVGGRLDPANLIDADIAAITNVDYDHCELLGNSLDEIGLEKVAIARKDKPLFLGSKMPDSIYLYANDIGAVICDDTHESTAIDCFQHSYNISISIAEYLLRKRHINYITKLDHVKANGRCMMLKDDHKNESYVFVDVAHNPASVEHMFELAKLKFKYRDVKYEAIFGLLKGKDVSKILTIAKPYIKKWDIIDLSFIDSRALDIGQLQDEFVRHNIFDVDFHENLESVNMSKKNTVTVVFGSFVLAGEFIKNYDKNCK